MPVAASVFQSTSLEQRMTSQGLAEVWEIVCSQRQLMS